MNKTQVKTLSIVIPAYNDEHSLPHLVKNFIQTLQTISISTFEIIIVNDGSQDTTHNVIESLKKEYPQIIAIHHAKNQGYSATLRDGFSQAIYEYVFYTDGDNQFYSEDLPALLAKANPNTVVIGYRPHKRYTAYRHLLSNGYNFITRTILGLPYKDINCAFKLFPTSLLKNNPLHSIHGLIDTELMHHAKLLNYNVIELPVKHRARKEGSGLGGSPAMILNTTKELLKFLFTGKA